MRKKIDAFSQKQKEVFLGGISKEGETPNHEKYQAIFLLGSRGSGKTFIANLYFFHLVCNWIRQGANVLVIGNNRASTLSNVIEPIIAFDPSLFSHNKMEGMVTYMPRDIKIRYLGMDNRTSHERIVAPSYEFAYIDEFPLIPRTVYETLITKLRGMSDDGHVRGKPFLATMNAERADHWMYELIYKRQEELNYKFYEFTPDDNPKLDGDFVERMKVTLPLSEQARLIDNQWITHSDDSMFSIHVDCLYKRIDWQDKNIKVIAHIDLAFGGGDTTALTIGYKKNEKYYVYGKIYHGNSMDHVPRYISELAKYNVGTLLIETNPDKGAMTRDFKRESKKTDFYGESGLFIKSYHEKENKNQKIIKRLTELLNTNSIMFDVDTDREYLNQITLYSSDMSSKDHDDAPDSLACFIRNYFQSVRIEVY